MCVCARARVCVCRVFYNRKKLHTKIKSALLLLWRQKGGKKERRKERKKEMEQKKKEAGITTRIIDAPIVCYQLSTRNYISYSAHLDRAMV